MTDNCHKSDFNVVFIRSQFPDSRLEKEALSLQKKGYEISLIVWDRGRNPTYNPNTSLNVIKFERSVAQDSIIVALFLPIWWTFIILHLIKMKAHVIHAIDFDCFFPSLIFAKATNTRIIYEIFDFYGDMIRFPIFPEFFRILFSSLDRYLMQFSNLIIIVDDSRRVQIRKKLDIQVVTIVNSPLSIKYQDCPTLHSNRKFSIFYGGAITEDRFILEMSNIVKNIADVQLTIIGPCPDKYRKCIEDSIRGSTNIFTTFHWLGHDELIQYTQKADLLFALYNPYVFNNRFASPNKLFEAMMCGKPIIVNDNTTMANIVKNENCGIVVPFGDIKAIEQAILKLKEDHKFRQILGANGRKAYEVKYSWKIMENRLSRLYQYVIDEEE